MIFLDTNATREQIPELLVEASEAIYAVAFVGGGARSWLTSGDADLKKLTIVCDAESGACNPDELQALNGEITLRTKRGLHAKVFWTDKAVLIGSSNLSANGLGFEGSEAAGNIEASFVSRDPAIISEVRRWLDATVLRVSLPISATLLARCRKAWEKRRDARDKLCAYENSTTTTKNIAMVMKQTPEYFTDKYISLWIRLDVDASEDAYVLLDKCKKEFKDSALDMYEVDGKKLKLKPFQFIIDFSHFDGEVADGGMWQVIERPFAESNKTKILLVRRVYNFEGINYRGSTSYLKKFVLAKIRKNPSMTEIFPIAKVSREMKTVN